MCCSKFPKSNGVWELQDCTSSFLVWTPCWEAEETIPTRLGWEDPEHSRASRSGLLVTRSVPVAKQGPGTWPVLKETYLRGKADHRYIGSSRLLLGCRLFSLDMTVWLVWMHTWEFSSWMQSGSYFSVYTRNRSKLAKSWDTTERLHFRFSLSCIGEGNGNPFQYSCLENLRDGRAWWAAVYGVAQSLTRLKWLSSSSSSSSRSKKHSHIGNRSITSEARCLALNPVFVSLSFLG